MRISDDIESIIESVEPTIDHIIDQELEFDAMVEAAASVDVVDPVDITNDDEINEIVNTAIGAGLITDNDVDDIASGKLSISDEVDEEADKADKEIEEYADDAIRDGILAKEEVEAILNGVPVMEALDIDFDEEQETFDEEEVIIADTDADEAFNESIAEKLGIKKPADEKSRAKALKTLGAKVLSTVRGVFGRDRGEVIEKLTKEDERKFIKEGKSVKVCQLQYNPFMAKRRSEDRKKGLGVGYAPGVGLYLKDKDLEDFQKFAALVGDKLKEDALKFGCRIYSSEFKDLKERIKKRQGFIISWYLEPRKYFFESEESELDLANMALTFDTGINFNEAEDDIDAIFSLDEESTPQPTQSGKEVASKPQAGQTDKEQAGEKNQKAPVPGTPKQEEDDSIVDRDSNTIDMEINRDEDPTFEGDRKAFHDDEDDDRDEEERIIISSDDDDDDQDDFDDDDHDDDDVTIGSDDDDDSDDGDDSDDSDDDHDEDDDQEDESDESDNDDKGVFKMDESMKLNFVEQAQEVCQEMELNKVDTMNTFDGAGINADDVEFGYKGPEVGSDEKNLNDDFKKEDTVPDNIFKDSFWDEDLDPSIEEMEIGK